MAQNYYNKDFSTFVKKHGSPAPPNPSRKGWLKKAKLKYPRQLAGEIR